MTYQDQLSPWVVHQLLPDLCQRTIARFRNRNDADAYLKVVNRMMPQHEFAVTFEIQPARRVASTVVKEKATKTRASKSRASKAKTAVIAPAQ